MTEPRSTDRERRTALITGASGGIGTELAAQFARGGYDLVLVARGEEALDRLATRLQDRHGVTARVVPMDLSEPNAAADLYEAVRREDFEVDALVNNAATATYGNFRGTDWEEERSAIQLNLVTLTELTKLFCRPMCDRGDGRILNVASTVGLVPQPMAAVYAATKAYVVSFSIAIADELSDYGVSVTVTCPNTTDTDMIREGSFEQSRLGDLPEELLLDPETVARDSYAALERGETVVVPGGIEHKLLAQSRRLAPQDTIAGIMRRLIEDR